MAWPAMWCVRGSYKIMEEQRPYGNVWDPIMEKDGEKERQIDLISLPADEMIVSLDEQCRDAQVSGRWQESPSCQQ